MNWKKKQFDILVFIFSHKFNGYFEHAEISANIVYLKDNQDSNVEVKIYNKDDIIIIHAKKEMLFDDFYDSYELLKQTLFFKEIIWYIY